MQNPQEIHREETGLLNLSDTLLEQILRQVIRLVAAGGSKQTIRHLALTCARFNALNVPIIFQCFHQAYRDAHKPEPGRFFSPRVFDLSKFKDSFIPALTAAIPLQAKPEPREPD